MEGGSWREEREAKSTQRYPRPCSDEQLGKPGAIPDPREWPGSSFCFFFRREAEEIGKRNLLRVDTQDRAGTSPGFSLSHLVE